VETILDSSQYFVLRIEDGRGKHAFVGLGFAERNEAFDFNVALLDHEKHVRREQEKDTGESTNDTHIDIHPAVCLFVCFGFFFFFFVFWVFDARGGRSGSR
jgi:hypothetical protein